MTHTLFKGLYEKESFILYKKIKELFRKDKHSSLLKLYNLFSISIKECRVCHGPIIYYDTMINISKRNETMTVSITGKNLFSTKKDYRLSCCEDCLINKFPSYKEKNKSRIFNRMCPETQYAFNIPDEVYLQEKNKFVVKSLENFIAKYGKDDGQLRWDSYRHKQSITNTFEYKNKKYGMTIDDFKKYNLRRGVTVSNMIKKYGSEMGLKKYDDYIEKQRLTSPFGYSNSANNFFKELDSKLLDDGLNVSDSMFRPKNKEKRLITKDNKVYFLDYYLPTYNIAIEYFGNYWHMNPDICNENDYNSHVKENAGNIWNKYKKRISEIYNNFGIKTFIIWEANEKTGIADLVRTIKQYIDDTRN